MGAKSRNKGAAGEREAVCMAIECGHRSAHRTAPMQAGHADDYGDIGGVQGLYLEVKRHARVPVSRLACELVEVERPGYTSVLLSRDDGERWLATLDAREYLRGHDEYLRLRDRVLFLEARLRNFAPSDSAGDPACTP